MGQPAREREEEEEREREKGREREEREQNAARRRRCFTTLWFTGLDIGIGQAGEREEER
jgi:hypothetical protein